MTIIEVIISNLLPQPLAATVVATIRDVLPLMGIALIRIALYTTLYIQKVKRKVFQTVQRAKLFKMDNVWIDQYKKLRA